MLALLQLHSRPIAGASVSLRAAVAQRHLSEAPLRVSGELVEALLASPLRRFFALAFDFLLMVPPSFAVALGAALLALRLQDPAAFAALPAALAHEPAHPAPDAALAAIAPVLVHQDAKGLPPEVAVAVHHGDGARAAALLRELDFLFNLRLGGKEDRPLPPRTVRVEVAEFIPHGIRAVTTYGVMAIYFGLLTAGRRGQTLGKRLVGIRVARLDGERLSLLASLERFVGYLHIPGTLGISLFDLWHDPNRRMPHDRVAHTVVIRARPAKREPAEEATQPAPPEPAPAASGPSADAVPAAPATTAPRVDD